MPALSRSAHHHSIFLTPLPNPTLALSRSAHYYVSSMKPVVFTHVLNGTFAALRPRQAYSCVCRVPLLSKATTTTDHHLHPRLHWSSQLCWSICSSPLTPSPCWEKVIFDLRVPNDPHHRPIHHLPIFLFKVRPPGWLLLMQWSIDQLNYPL